MSMDPCAMTCSGETVLVQCMPLVQSSSRVVAGVKRPRLQNEWVHPYQVLQVRRDATPSELREAYRRLALWHHPGRCNNKEDREKRYKSFVIISACYELLQDNDHRQRYDMFVYQLERNFIMGGEILVGGKPLVTIPWSSTKEPAIVMDYTNVCGTTTTTTTTPGDGDASVDAIPALISSSSSTTSSGEGEIHYSEVETTRLYGGPLELLYKARRWQPFTNPYIVFDKVFGSSVFSQVQIDNTCSSTAITAAAAFVVDGTTEKVPTTPAVWTATTTTQPDGSIVSTTSRIWMGRKLTRTERIITLKDGKRHSTVHVTAVPWNNANNKDHDTDDHNHAGFNFNCCGSGTLSSSAEARDDDDVHDDGMAWSDYWFPCGGGAMF